MKNFTYLLLFALCLISYKAKAQTSATMGLNGVVEEYQTNSSHIYTEYASFNPSNKRLTSYMVYCSTPGAGWTEPFEKWITFKVKGKRPTNISRMLEFDGSCYRWSKLYFNFSYKYSGNKVVSVTHKLVEKENLNPDCFYDHHVIETHVQKNYTITFKYTKYDKFGNWIERIATLNGDSWTETRTITYNEEWLTKQRIASEKNQILNYEKNNDIKGLESYLKHDLQSQSKTFGINTWNKMVCKDENLTDPNKIAEHATCSYATESTIVALKQAWSNMNLKSLIADNNFEGLYTLAQDSLCTAEAAASAQAYWNEKKWASVNNANASYQAIAKVAAHPFAYSTQARTGWQRVQQLYYDKVVLSHNDFREVDSDYVAKIEGKRIFTDKNYANKVIARRDSLRNAEIAFYLNIAQEAAKQNSYKAAVEASQHVLSINPNLHDAIDLSAENGKLYLQQLKKQSKLTDKDLETYIAQNPKGAYTEQTKDFRALRLAKQAHSNKQSSNFEQILKLPMSQEAKEKINKLQTRTINRKARGSFFHIGGEASVGYGFGKDMLEGGGGAYLRFGWTVSPINLTTGFTYNVHKNLTLSTNSNDEDKSIIRGAMDYATMEIPLQLRWNLLRDTDFAMYLAAGAEYHLNKKGKIAYKDPDSKEKTFYEDNAILKKSNFVGYYSLGWEFKHGLGLEFYVKHDFTDRFDKDYVRQHYTEQNPMNLLLFKKAENTQLGKNWSIGFKMRIFY